MALRIGVLTQRPTIFQNRTQNHLLATLQQTHTRMLTESTRLTRMILTISSLGTGRSKLELGKMSFKPIGEQMEIVSQSNMASEMGLRSNPTISSGQEHRQRS